MGALGVSEGEAEGGRHRRRRRQAATVEAVGDDPPLRAAGKPAAQRALRLHHRRDHLRARPHASEVSRRRRSTEQPARVAAPSALPRSGSSGGNTQARRNTSGARLPARRYRGSSRPGVAFTCTQAPPAAPRSSTAPRYAPPSRPSHSVSPEFLGSISLQEDLEKKRLSTLASRSLTQLQLPVGSGQLRCNCSRASAKPLLTSLRAFLSTWFVG